MHVLRDSRCSQLSAVLSSLELVRKGSKRRSSCAKLVRTAPYITSLRSRIAVPLAGASGESCVFGTRSLQGLAVQDSGIDALLSKCKRRLVDVCVSSSRHKGVAATPMRASLHAGVALALAALLASARADPASCYSSSAPGEAPVIVSTAGAPAGIVCVRYCFKCIGLDTCAKAHRTPELSVDLQGKPECET